jgi:phosphoribosylformylglycinamidine synthase
MELIPHIVDQETKNKLNIYRLSEAEFEMICILLGRTPRGVEWALFSALWSEHCSYKSSKIHLKRLFNKSGRVVESFGENAGVIDLGEGERIAFKIESHNHPSFIEPYQGAATGVGGILRDIFTMGARPIALANYLCFGDPAAARMPALVDGVVRGIGGYGNCVGVPTVTGQTEFHETYDKNILVNAMAVGLFRPGEKIYLSKAQGPGNWVVYVGAKTGRDGVHGASMASESFDANASETKRPTVQIGDPFYEKLLIESCLEAMKADLVVAIQDMGAAGLTSTSFEMASKGGVGVTLDLDKVPLRDTTMSPEEILLSESQERMLLVCEPSKFDELAAVFHRWDLDAVKIGEVTPDRLVRLRWRGDLLTEIDPDILVENAPQYQRPWKELFPSNRVKTSAELDVVNDESLGDTLMEILRHAQGTSREWIYRQYDSRVGAATARGCSESVGVLQLRDSQRALGIVLGCRPHMMRFDPRVGGVDAVAYPAMELAIKGFEALAVTDCLNYGNPEVQDVMSEFVASLAGMNDICRAIETPIISGNVSFYNATGDRNITPTPATGLIGLRGSIEQIPLNHFSIEGEQIYLLRLPGLLTGGMRQELSQMNQNQNQIRGVGNLNCDAIASFVKLLREMSFVPGVTATRLVGKFGLAYAMARMAIGGNVGAQIDLSSVGDSSEPLGVKQFGERLYEAVFVVAAGLEAEFKTDFAHLVAKLGSPAELIQIGKTGSLNLRLDPSQGEIAIAKLSEAYHAGWGEKFENLA